MVTTVESLRRLFRAALRQLNSDDVQALGLTAQDMQNRAMSLDRLYSKIWGALPPDGWLVSVVVDDNGGMKAISYDWDANLYAQDVVIAGDDVTLGDPMRVTEVYQPIAAPEDVERMHNKMFVRQQADGSFRWFAVACSTVLNRSFEIDSRELFDTFVERFNNGDNPFYLTLRHVGQSAYMGDGDFVKRYGDLLLTSGTFDTDPDNILAQAAITSIQRDSDYWGISIGYMPEDADPPPNVEVIRANTESGELEMPVNVYTRGTLVECSILAEQECAAHFTSVSRMEIYRTMPTKRQNRDLQTDLQTLFGDDTEAIEATLKRIQGTQRAIDENGLIRRDSDPATEEPATVIELDETVTGLIVDAVLNDPRLAAVIASVSTTPPADQNADTLAEMRQQLETERERANLAMGLLRDIGIIDGDDDEPTPTRVRVQAPGGNRPRVNRAPEHDDDDDEEDGQRNATADMLATALTSATS